MKKIGRFLSVFLFCIFLFSVASIAEDITLTTYYPAPYGAYDELSTTGDTFLATGASGNVGIGTTSAGTKLAVIGLSHFAGNAAYSAANAVEIGNDLYLADIDTANTIAVKGAQDQTVGSIKFGNTGGTVSGYLNRIGINVTNPGYALDVAGDIHTTGDVITDFTTYPDYVFEPGYTVMPLHLLRAYVLEHKHLPSMPSTADIRNDGVKLFEQNRLLLEKLEEAYLYIFELEKRIEKLERR